MNRVPVTSPGTLEQASARQQAPRISVVIGTRDRGAGIAATLTSIQASTLADWELIVADQSGGDATEVVVQAAMVRDPRIAYVRTATTGISAARNVAIAQARAPYIAITDDDCEVAPDWLAGIVAEFEANPRVACIAGTLEPAQFEPGTGYIPNFCPEERIIVTEPWPTTTCFGASMALRAQVLDQVGFFDELMGPGTTYSCMEEQDLCHRVLLAGHHALIAPDLRVVHYGFRSNAQVAMIWMRDARGVGGMIAKEMHYQPLHASQWLLSWWGYWIGIVIWNALTGKRPLKIRQTLAYLRHSASALSQGMRHPMVPGFRAYAPQSWVKEATETRKEAGRGEAGARETLAR